jgi:hypothetical protein
VVVVVVRAVVVSRVTGNTTVHSTGAVGSVNVEEVGVVLEVRLEVTSTSNELVDTEGLVDGRLVDDGRLVGGLVGGDDGVDLGVLVDVTLDLGLDDAVS